MKIPKSIKAALALLTCASLASCTTDAYTVRGVLGFRDPDTGAKAVIVVSPKKAKNVAATK